MQTAAVDNKTASRDPLGDSFLLQQNDPKDYCAKTEFPLRKPANSKPGGQVCPPAPHCVFVLENVKSSKNLEVHEQAS